MPFFERTVLGAKPTMPPAMSDPCPFQAEFGLVNAHACRMPDQHDALFRWLSERLPSAAKPLTLRRFSGGQSNPTYALEMPGTRLVLRAKPTGELLPSAHQIEREFRVLRALEQTPIPVPRVFVLCEDPAIFGTPFYVMEYLDGRVLSDPALPHAPPSERAALYDAAFATLADLHHIDYRAIGLDDFGRSDGYLARQVARWTRQYRASQTAAIESMERLMSWLPEHVPADDAAAIAHGDYRLGNLMFDAVEPRVIGVLDWELSTIGHPLLDLAYALLTHEMPLAVLSGMGASAELAAVPGIPSADELIDRYCVRAGRRRPADLHFYLALAFFRSAAIMQGIRARIALGNAAGGREAEARAAVTPLLADLGWRIARNGV